MEIKTQLQQRLKDGGWTLQRHGKHEVWTLPDGQTMTLGTTMRDVSHKRANYLKQIERCEQVYQNRNIPGALYEPEIVMNAQLPLISSFPINGAEVNAVNARDLHAYLGAGARFNDWIRRRIDEYGFTEHKDFECYSNLSNNGPKDYMISIDMAKELCMVERNEKGKEARQYFIECERRALSGMLVKVEAQPVTPVNPFSTASRRDLLWLALEQEEKLEALGGQVQTLGCKVQEQQETISKLEPMVEQQIQELQDKDSLITALKPLAEFASDVMATDDLIHLNDFAQVLGVGRNTFRAWLRAEGFTRKPRYLAPDAPYQKWVDEGVFTVKERVSVTAAGGRCVAHDIFVTGQGQVFLREKWAE
jgi:anti-repressor protein